jgi:hypothetical protein
MSKYTHQQMIDILRICQDLGNGNLSLSTARQKVRSISSNYPIQTLETETARVIKYLEGQSTFGYGYAATWAEALLEMTNNNSKVISALREQQNVYLNKTGKNNRKLERLLNETENI